MIKIFVLIYFLEENLGRELRLVVVVNFVNGMFFS